MPGNVIIFDFFGVICSEIAPFWLAKYFSEERAKEVKKTIVHAADTGELSQQELFSVLGEFVHISPAQVEAEWLSYVVINEELVEIVRNLKADNVLVLLTNSPAPFVRYILREHNLADLFDHIVVSSEEECAKPDPRIYQRLLERLKITPEDAFMIDDNPVNIQGAVNVGMKGLVFESNDQLRETLINHRYLSSSSLNSSFK